MCPVAKNAVDARHNTSWAARHYLVLRRKVKNMKLLAGIAGGILLGAVLGALTCYLLAMGAIVLWYYGFHWSPGGWFSPDMFGGLGASIGGLAGAVLGPRLVSNWKQRQLVKIMPPLEALSDEQNWPPSPHHS